MNRRQKTIVLGLLILGTGACFRVALALTSKTLAVLGCVLVALLAIVAAGIGSSLPMNQKLTAILRWVRLAVRPGTTPRAAIERLLFDIGLGLVVILLVLGPPVVGLYYVGLNWQLGAYGLVLLFLWLAYRRHRRKEHYRGFDLNSSLPEAIELIFDIERRVAPDVESLWGQLTEILGDLRRVLLRAHNKDGDPELSLWLYQPNLDDQQFRCMLVVHGESLPEDCCSRVLENDRKPFYRVVTNAKTSEFVRFEHGSICALVLFNGGLEIQGNVSRCDNSSEQEAFNPTHLLLLNEEIRQNFLSTSYLSVPLTSRQPSNRLSGAVFPLFAVHSRPVFFTDYDRCLFENVSNYISRFLSRHHHLLPRSATFYPFEKHALEGWITQSVASRYTPLASTPVPRTFRSLKREAVTINGASETRRQLAEAEACPANFWPVVESGYAGKVFGCEVTHKPIGATASLSARDILSRRSLDGIALDLLWASKALQVIGELGQNISPFLRLEWRTMGSARGHEFAKNLSTSLGRKPVILLPVPQHQDPIAKKTVQFLNGYGFEVCYEGVSESSSIDLAVDHGVKWIRFPIELSQAAVVNSEHEKRIRYLLGRTKEKELRAIVPGIINGTMWQANGWGSLVHLQGLHFRSLIGR